jgi:RimJ/RimL family protein N-acetyltransferase
MQTSLSSQNLVFHPIERALTQEIISVCNFEETSFFTNSFPFPYTMEHAVAFKERAQNEYLEGLAERWGIYFENQFIGIMGLHPKMSDGNAFIGYMMHPDFHGKGWMKESVSTLIQYGFEHKKLHKIYAETLHTNVASQKVLIANGFQPEYVMKQHVKKQDVFYDLCGFSTFKKDYKLMSKIL